MDDKPAVVVVVGGAPQLTLRPAQCVMMHELFTLAAQKNAEKKLPGFRLQQWCARGQRTLCLFPLRVMPPPAAQPSLDDARLGTQ